LKLTFAALVVASCRRQLGHSRPYKKDSWLDVTAMTISLFGICDAGLLLGLVLILVFAVWLQWLPSSGKALGLILPALTLD